MDKSHNAMVKVSKTIMVNLSWSFFLLLWWQKNLLPTKSIFLANTIKGRPLKAKFKNGFEYSDYRVDDTRLLILNARDGQHRVATILPRVKLIAAERTKNNWKLTFQNQNTCKNIDKMQDI